MARRIVNRMEKRAEFDAYERRQDEDEVEEGEKDEAEEEKEEDDEDEAEEEKEPAEQGQGQGQGEDEEGEVPAPKKKKKVVKVPKPKATRTRTRAPKVAPRMKVVWGVFNNSNQRVATFDYPKKTEADAHAAKLRSDKNQTFFVQPVKEPIEEKKEKEKS